MPYNCPKIASCHIADTQIECSCFVTSLVSDNAVHLAESSFLASPVTAHRGTPLEKAQWLLPEKRGTSLWLDETTVFLKTASAWQKLGPGQEEMGEHLVIRYCLAAVQAVTISLP